MHIKFIQSKRPNCDICGKQMKTWHPFTNKHTHAECSGKKIGMAMADNLKKQLEQ